jgi:hypothetical protein
MDEGLGDPAREVGGGSVDFGVILPRKGSPAVGAPTTVRVYDDLASSKTGISLRTADDE